MSQRGWIGVDLDGTLAHYDGWQGPFHIGEPIPRMVERVKQWLVEGVEVRIVTARVYCGESEDPTTAEQWRELIAEWCEQNVGQRLRVTCQKDYGMVELWDDRAVQVIPNSGVRADGQS